ncbi:MAG: hypothetical protein CVV49_13835 [Spirochaetae bacterium HGW-Spirochaetae-5]|nr:MAG: hypothetical protein CVV49_13835 [Spirochaetae bacterium HGW-Spirochaetae-5]
MKENELMELKKVLTNAKSRINSGNTYAWKDALRFLPTVSLSRRSLYDDAAANDTETYLSASISLNQVFDMTDIADKKNAEKRKAVRRVESLGYTIQKLIERKFLITDQMWKMKLITKSIEDPLEASKCQEKVDQLQLQLNDTFIEIEKLFAEIEYVCVEVER